MLSGGMQRFRGYGEIKKGGGGEGREDPKTFPSKHYIKISNQLYSLRQVRNSLTMWFFFFLLFCKNWKK